MKIIFHFTFVNFPALCPKMETSFLDGHSHGHLTRSSPGWSSRTGSIRSWGNMSSVLAIKCHQMNQLPISFYFQRCIWWRLTRHLRKKKSMLAQETSVIQVHQVKSIRLQRFLLLFHFSVQLGIAGLLNTIPGRSSVQFSCSVVYDSLHPMDCSFPGFPVHHQLRELAQTHVCWVGDVIQSSHPLSSPFPPAFNLSQHQGLFQWVYSSHQVAKLLEFQLQHQSFQWIAGLISFRMDWFDLLAVQGTLKSLRQHCNSKASILSEGETS